MLEIIFLVFSVLCREMYAVLFCFDPDRYGRLVMVAYPVLKTILDEGDKSKGSNLVFLRIAFDIKFDM